MVMLAINWVITSHGGGIHQWNVTEAQVQYNYRVGSHHHVTCRQDLQSITKVHELRRHNLQSSPPLHQALHPLTNPTRFLLRPTKRSLLPDSAPDSRQYSFLQHLFLHPNLRLPSSIQNLEPPGAWSLLED